MKYIDNEAEHHQILFNLGLLDDEEDWKMFQEQERRFEEPIETIDLDQYLAYVNKQKRL